MSRINLLDIEGELVNFDTYEEKMEFMLFAAFHQQDLDLSSANGSIEHTLISTRYLLRMPEFLEENSLDDPLRLSLYNFRTKEVFDKLVENFHTFMENFADKIKQGYQGKYIHIFINRFQDESFRDSSFFQNFIQSHKDKIEIKLCKAMAINENVTFLSRMFIFNKAFRKGVFGQSSYNANLSFNDIARANELREEFDAVWNDNRKSQLIQI